jgi:enoyl-CoA hydratase
MDDILFTSERQLGIITLNRQHALNALSLPMILALQEQLLHWQNDEKIHAVVIQAAAGKAFCAGGDVRWLYETGRSHNPQNLQFFWHEYQLNHLIHHLGKPYIALMNGITMGGGVGISLHGSHSVASEQFIFAMPETSIGFFPDIGASHLLSRCPNGYGMYLGLTGERIAAEEAHALGLVKHVIASERFAEVVAQLLDLDLSTHAFAKVSHCLNAMSTVQAVPLNPHVPSCFKKSTLQAIMEALLQSADPWCVKIATLLSHKSPLSLHVTFEQLQRAASMDLASCLNMDFGLVNHFMHGHDFYEGVRALLVDKDKSPKWQPPSLADVNLNVVQKYFEWQGIKKIEFGA